MGCGGRFEQPSLQRFHLDGGAVAPGPGPGRGAYTCRRRACLERAVARRGFARALRASVTVPAGLPDLFDQPGGDRP